MSAGPSSGCDDLVGHQQPYTRLILHQVAHPKLLNPKLNCQTPTPRQSRVSLETFSDSALGRPFMCDLYLVRVTCMLHCLVVSRSDKSTRTTHSAGVRFLPAPIHRLSFIKKLEGVDTYSPCGLLSSHVYEHMSTNDFPPRIIICPLLL